MKLSVVVPVYNEQDNISLFVTTVIPHLASVTKDYEIIFACDPSQDSTWDFIGAYHSMYPEIKAVLLSRRFGQPMAALAGLAVANGDLVVVMDVDLQDPPSMIPTMIEKAREGFDVVYAKRSSRDGDSWIYRLFAWMGYRLLWRMAEVRIPHNVGDFRLMSRRVVDELLAMKESHGFLRGMTALVGFRQASVEFERPARLRGKTHYSRVWGSLKIGLNGLFCFSRTPLLFIFWAGALTLGSCPFFRRLDLFLSGVILLALWTLGEYIGRIYEEVKNRPKFIIQERLGL